MTLFEEGNGKRSNRSTSEKLTYAATQLAREAFEIISADEENYADRIVLSKTDGTTLDTLLKEVVAIPDMPDLFAGLDPIDLNNMLKSQQSKRSRCKSAAMTMDNYKKLMTAAIAELIIRGELGTEKSDRKTGVRKPSRELTTEYVESLADNQEELKRELRNVQSKKSILKKKGNIEEGEANYDTWQKLCEDEALLKSKRIGAVPQVAKVVEINVTKDAVTGLLKDVDITKLKAGDSKELLAKIAELVADQQPEE